MKEEVVIVLDCGATNIRAMAVNHEGRIVASGSSPNGTSEDPFWEGGRIWDVENILAKLGRASTEVCDKLGDVNIRGVCTTSFGVDGTFFNASGEQLYPVISWACGRTHGIIEDVHQIMPLADLWRITGLYTFHFNTLYKLHWFRTFRKDVLEKADHWLFMPAIISGFLSGERFTDVSMLGTSMLCDRKRRRFSDDILGAFGLRSGLFPTLHEAGERVGEVTREASNLFGIPRGIPVFAAGHDTQFAIFGSGAGTNEPVLSSGTWEILMVRTPSVSAGEDSFHAGITTELDVVPGLFNPGLQWLASAKIEAVKKKYYHEVLQRPDVYDIMIGEAEKSTPGDTGRGGIFRAVLEELTDKAKQSLHLLEMGCGFKSSSLRVVGGGSRNRLWNRMRAEVLDVEIKTIEQAETTVLGAAMFAFTGAGIYPSVEEARDAFL